MVGDEISVKEAGRRGGLARTEAKTAANPAVKRNLEKATAAAAKANLKELDQIPCCGKTPHNKSCPRFKAMVRRGMA